LHRDRSEATEGIGNLRYLFEEYVFDTDLRELRRGAEVISVAPQVFDLLDYLIRNRECVVSKDDLIRAVWKGRIVSDAALTTRLNAVRSAIGDTGEKQRLVKTLPRKGFRFVATVQEDQKRTVEPVGLTEHSGDTSAARLSIVALPFANLSNDSEQDYFVDGITESLTTDLSRISGSFVIGRHTAFTYKGKAVDLKQLGCELNVRYVLEGSVQRGGSRLRVNVQLADAENGAYLWADRFDKPLSDLFDMQDEIVSRLANQLGTELVTAEARRADRAPHPNSMDLYFQGMACVNRGLAPENLSQARGLFERALALDGGNIEALVEMAFVDAMRGTGLMTDDRSSHLAAAEAALTKVLSMMPSHAKAHCLFGVVQIFTKRADQGIAECEQALALDRNLAQAHGWIGLAKCFTGRAEEAEAHVLDAFRLSPRDNKTYDWMTILGIAKICLGDDVAAVAAFRRSIETIRNVAPFTHFFLAAALAHLGRLDDARAAVQAGFAVDPAFTIGRFRVGATTDNPTYLSQRERLVVGMRIAGVPEG
jgi:TolB-like protein/Flp pilus assembly protein TadD